MSLNELLKNYKTAQAYFKLSNVFKKAAEEMIQSIAEDSTPVGIRFKETKKGIEVFIFTESNLHYAKYLKFNQESGLKYNGKGIELEDLKDACAWLYNFIDENEGDVYKTNVLLYVYLELDIEAKSGRIKIPDEAIESAREKIKLKLETIKRGSKYLTINGTSFFNRFEFEGQNIFPDVKCYAQYGSFAGKSEEFKQSLEYFFKNFEKSPQIEFEELEDEIAMYIAIRDDLHIKYLKFNPSSSLSYSGKGIELEDLKDACAWLYNFIHENEGDIYDFLFEDIEPAMQAAIRKKILPAFESAKGKPKLMPFIKGAHLFKEFKFNGERIFPDFKCCKQFRQNLGDFLKNFMFES